MKFFGKCLTPAEEEKLILPSRRKFFIGALSTLCLAAAPAGFVKLGNVFVPDNREWTQLMGMNWAGPQVMPPGMIEELIRNIKRNIDGLCALRPEDLRHRFEPDKFGNSSDRCTLIIESCAEIRPNYVVVTPIKKAPEFAKG